MAMNDQLNKEAEHPKQPMKRRNKPDPVRLCRWLNAIQEWREANQANIAKHYRFVVDQGEKESLKP